MKKLKCIALLLVLPLLFSLAACKKDKTKPPLADSLNIALTGEAISAHFAKNPNPLYASNETEFAIGSLVAPGLMRYDAEKGWQSLLGSIEVEVVDGKTVATVTIDDGKTYSNGRKPAIKDYQLALKRICSIGYDGYYADYYKNPIEGLVAYRYGVEGLLASSLPDFEKQTEEKLSDLTKEEYQALLIETSIAELYPEKANPQTLCPDGRTFKEFVVEETKDPEKRLDTFFIGDQVRERMLVAIAEIYADMPEDQWMLLELKQPILNSLEKAFAAEKQAGAQRTSEISGFKISNTKIAKITFEKEVDRDTAIAILNIPLIYSQSQAPESAVTGAGSYRASGYSNGSQGYIIILSSKEERALSITVLEEEQLLPTLYMGQISAAPYNGSASQSELEKSYGVAFLDLGAQTVMYDPDATDEAELKAVSGLFMKS